MAGILSRETLNKVAEIIHGEALAQRDCQFTKRALTDFNKKSFCPLNAFKRIDRQGKGNINSLDLVSFFRDNNKVIPEADTYMLITAFDSNMDGKLSLIE
jgi:Ca2+-binding EF-hand superfamily protein